MKDFILEKDLVCVVIPCFNYGIYLREAVDSVLNSTYSPIEIVIVNDGSTDNTDEIAREIISRHRNIYYIIGENQGPAIARNKGIQGTKAEFILPLDADDKISAYYISQAVDVLKKNPEVKVVYCKARFFGLKKGVWKLNRFSQKELVIKNMIFSCAMFRKEDWKNCGGFSSELVGGWEDWEFWISMLKNGGLVHQLDIFGFYYRIHQGSRQKCTTGEIEFQTEEFINRKHHDFIFSLINRPFQIRKKKRLSQWLAIFFQFISDKSIKIKTVSGLIPYSRVATRRFQRNGKTDFGEPQTIQKY